MVAGRVAYLCVLSAKCECGAGDARREVQVLDDLLPQFLIDDVHETAAAYHQLVELVEIED